VGDVRVVVEEAGAARAPGAAAAVETPLVVGERAEQELGKSPRLVDEIGVREPPPRLGQGREREPVPRGDRLVVETRLRTLRADLEQPRPRLVVEPAAQDEAAFFEGLEHLLRRALTRSPRVREALDAVGVRVLRRREAAFLETQVAEQVLDGLFRDLAVALVSGHSALS